MTVSTLLPEERLQAYYQRVGSIPPVAGPVLDVAAALRAVPSAHVTSIEVSGPLPSALELIAARRG